MSRFILRFRGDGPKPAADVERIRNSHNVTLLDDSSPSMVLVDAPEDELLDLLKSIPGWLMIKEQMIPLPDVRPKPRPHARQKR